MKIKYDVKHFWVDMSMIPVTHSTCLLCAITVSIRVNWGAFSENVSMRRRKLRSWVKKTAMPFSFDPQQQLHNEITITPANLRIRDTNPK